MLWAFRLVILLELWKTRRLLDLKEAQNRFMRFWMWVMKGILGNTPAGRACRILAKRLLMFSYLKEARSIRGRLACLG